MPLLSYNSTSSPPKKLKTISMHFVVFIVYLLLVSISSSTLRSFFKIVSYPPIHNLISSTSRSTYVNGWTSERMKVKISRLLYTSMFKDL